MKRLISTLDLSKEEWLGFRKQGVTGTDAGAIVGLNPYKSAFQVYQEKIADDIIEIPDNEAMRQGRDLEEYVSRRFAESTGLKVRRVNAIMQNEEHPFMLADFDRLIDGQKAGLECKTVSPYSADKWAEDQIPLHYQMQVQHYLAVSGYDCWYVAALVFGKEFIIRKIERDEELIDSLIRIEKNFWENNVLARAMPEPDGSESCSEMISKLYSSSDKGKTVMLDCEEILERRSEVDALIKKLSVEKESLDQSIKLKLGDAAYGVTSDYRVSWTSMEQNRLDTKRLKLEKPEVYEAYLKSSMSRRFTITHAA